MVNLTEQVYKAINTLPRYNHLTPKEELPDNGIYIFFENGENVWIDGKEVNRIVRIGTHKSDGLFKKRIRQHYGAINSLNGNKNGSVFRKHLGGALLRRMNIEDVRLNEWLTQDGLSYREVEEMVSLVLRQNFTFSCFRVDNIEERLELESAIIALLAQFHLGEPSHNWLGKYAASEKILQARLWNIQHITSSPMTLEQFDKLCDLINISGR